jgi:hypothetical protein
VQDVSKAQFEAVYFEYGREAGGWTRAYWERFYAAERTPPMKYKVELPQRPDQTRMMIVDDFAVCEHRLFFMSEEAEERLFDFPP